MINVDRDALELVLQTGGEMFGRTVFDTELLSPEIAWPRDDNPLSIPTLGKTELDELSNLLLKMVSDTLGEFKDSRIGFTLSGGVDSSLILYLFRRVYPDVEVIAYHSDWHYLPKSELLFAQMASKFTDTPLKVVDVSPSKQISHLDDALRDTKTVSYSSTPVYMVFKKMAEDDIEVAVNALGLDELFSGYTFHRKYYERSRFHILPASSRLGKFKYGPAAARRYGNDKAWFLAHVVPQYATPFVENSDVDFKALYEEKIKGNTLWNSMHNYLLTAMIYNFGNLIARPAKANGLKIVFPYMHKDLMRKCLDYNPISKINKEPIRTLMRQYYGFPEELANRGENWDKVGWGGTGIPYYENPSYMEKIKPNQSVAREWFTKEGLRILRKFDTKPDVRTLKMALFLKILELV